MKKWTGWRNCLAMCLAVTMLLTPFLQTEGIVFQIHCLLETSYCETRGLLELMEQLDAKGIGFVSEKEAIDTTTPTGKFMLTVSAAVAGWNGNTFSSASGKESLSPNRPGNTKAANPSTERLCYLY